MIPIIAVGELLIDFVCSDSGETLESGRNFIKKAGGAPANVCAAAARLGGDARFAGSVGNDSFGKFLIQVLTTYRVDTSCVQILPDNTTLAFVSLGDAGERDFAFVRGADEYFNDTSVFEKTGSGIIHFGSATAFLGGKLMETYIELMEIAREREYFISFDPNFRTDLWKGKEDDFICRVRNALRIADFAKFSDEEILMITGKNSLEAGVKDIHELGVRSVAVTLGSKGTLFGLDGKMHEVPSVKIDAVDTTGAGDAFVGAFLHSLSKAENPFVIFDDENMLSEKIFFANCAAALVCTKYGALESMPSYDEVEAIMLKNKAN